MDRVAFGNETKMLIVAARCPGCSADHGELHAYGCPLESCPQCGGRLLECTCKVLKPRDELRIIRAVSEHITGRAEVDRAMENGSQLLDRTYYEDGVMLWIMGYHIDRDPRHGDKLLEIMGWRRAGDGCVIGADEAASILGVSEEEAHDVLSEMQADSIYPGWEKHDGPVQ